MKMSTVLLVVILILAAAGSYLFFTCTDNWCLVTDYQKIKRADSFETCVALGFPVMESYPRQCKAGDKTFTEKVTTTTPGTTVGITHHDLIKITAPLAHAIVTSPLTVTGEARGNWYFEASFPVKLYDANGEQIAVVPAQAKGDWMTTNYVPFTVELTFDPPATDTGTLVLLKDNPSGLPENGDQVSIPVRFR